MPKEIVIKSRYRTGIGYDVHKLVKDRKLILGGERIEHPTGLLGHSDADVLTHAIMSALLGAISAGSLGDHFPDNDPQYKNISSLDLLERVRIIMEEKGWEIENVDSMVICDKPRMGKYIENIRMNLSEALRVPINRISVKATSTEGLSFTGTGEGIAAQAVCLLKQDYQERVKTSSKAKKTTTKKKKKVEKVPPLPEIKPGELTDVNVWTDGASSGNPGPCGIGIVFEKPDGTAVGKYAEAVGDGTNNQAEYKAVIKAAEICVKWGVERFSLKSDSELLVKQLNGQYRVKNPSITGLYTDLRQLLRQFKSWKAVHVRREKNTEADKLSKIALKK